MINCFMRYESLSFVFTLAAKKKAEKIDDITLQYFVLIKKIVIPVQDKIYC